jgi:hypothetical protein
MKVYEVPYICKKQITLVVIGFVGKEAEALRSTLEYYNYRVDTHWIGSKKELRMILSGEIKSHGIIVISCHGSSDGILVDGEPPLTAKDILMNSDLENKTILSTGCQTGKYDISKAIIDRGASAYIAPIADIDGDASLLFINHFFYFMNEEESIRQAYQKAHSFDDKSRTFKIYESGVDKI